MIRNEMAASLILPRTHEKRNRGMAARWKSARTAWRARQGGSLRRALGESVAGRIPNLATVFRPLLAVRSSVALNAEGLRLRDRFRLNWYDALIVASVAEDECEALYSEDFQDGRQMEGVTLSNPFR